MKNRLLSIVEKQTVVRARDLYRSGIHPEALSRALRRGLFLKIGRGLYARKDFSADFERQIMLACKRVPNGIVCLKSAVRFHGLLPLDSASIWMAIDPKAKKPVVNGLRLRFARFSGQALTQGVENIRIDGVPVRIYSAAKTIADCLKYRRKIGGNLAVKVLRESIARRKCSEQRLRHFSKICRVGRLVQTAYSLLARARALSFTRLEQFNLHFPLAGFRHRSHDADTRHLKPFG
jgi:predicted transcriptional regulator of viral defense system